MSREDADKIAIVNARVACALIQLEACKAANAERQIKGLALAYPEQAIYDLIADNLIGENDVIGFLYHSN